jgi:hypothetical protein
MLIVFAISKTCSLFAFPASLIFGELTNWDVSAGYLKPGISPTYWYVARPGRASHHAAMSMAELMRAVAGLPKDQQSELAAFLLHPRLRNDPAWRSEMTRRTDDTNSVNWVALEHWKKELAAQGETSGHRTL